MVNKWEENTYRERIRISAKKRRVSLDVPDMVHDIAIKVIRPFNMTFHDPDKSATRP